MKKVIELLETSFKAHKNNHDTVLIITGNEGFGKSNLLLDMVTEWERITGTVCSIDNIGLTQEQWIKAVSIAEPKVGIAPFDEAGDGLLSRDAMNDFNKDVIKMYTVIRGKCLMTILVLPSFWYLDKFFRMHRVKGMFFVYSRGRVAFWNKKQLKRMIIKGEDNQDVWAVKPSFRDGFPEYKGHLLEEYKIRKASKIAATIKAMSEKYATGEATLTDMQRFVVERLRAGETEKMIAEASGKTQQAINSARSGARKKGVEI